MNKASEMPMDFFLNRPDKTSVREYYYFKEQVGMMDELLAKRRGEIESQNLPDVPNAQADRGATLLTLQDFGRIVRHNNFLAAVSMLERQFKNVIEWFTHHKPEKELKKFALKGRSGTNLQQYFNYIKRTMKIDISEQWENLKELNKYYLYRHVIIHNIGYLDMPKDKETYDFLKNFSNVEIQEERGLALNTRTTITNNSFTIDFCTKAEKIIVRIFETISADSRFQKT